MCMFASNSYIVDLLGQTSPFFGGAALLVVVVVLVTRSPLEHTTG